MDVFQNLPANSGNDWYNLQLVTDLAGQGDVHLYYTQKEHGKQGYYPNNNLVKQKYLAPTVKWGKISRRLDQLRPEMLLDGSAVASVEADVVFARLYSYHIARHIARANEAPVVLVMHNVEWEYLKNGRYTPLIYAPARLYENYVLRKAGAVIALSPKDYAYATSITSAHKVFYIPHHPDVDMFNAHSPSRHEYGKGKLNVLFYGSLDRGHNIKALEFIKRDLIPEIKRRGLIDSIKISVFGSGTPPKRLDLEHDPNINFLGWVENPAPFIRGTDVVIVPVRNPSGVKIRVLEALFCNKPVIAFPQAAIGLENESSAAITIAHNAEGFVDALKSLVEYPPCLERTRCVHCSTQASTACDAARYALEQETKKKVRGHQFVLSNILH
jgi:glycosyltransferase involved in cell wall biosynthesis